jgi:hypothetical protein
MGDISREKLLSFARKTQGIEHLPPLEKLNKFVDNPVSKTIATILFDVTLVGLIV